MTLPPHWRPEVFVDFVIVPEGRYTYIRPIQYNYVRTDGRRAIFTEEARDLDILYPLPKE